MIEFLFYMRNPSFMPHRILIGQIMDPELD